MFKGAVTTQWLDDFKSMRILDALAYTDCRGRVWSVPAGYVTDGASIPQEFWALIGSPFTGRYRVPAIFHDAAYSTLGIKKDDADMMLYEASIECGCPRWIAEAIHAGVRLGGLEPYNNAQIDALLHP